MSSFSQRHTIPFGLMNVQRITFDHNICNDAAKRNQLRTQSGENYAAAKGGEAAFADITARSFLERWRIHRKIAHLEDGEFQLRCCVVEEGKTRPGGEDDRKEGVTIDILKETRTMNNTSDIEESDNDRVYSHSMKLWPA
ncbi:hypothetical protein M569_10846 [Genlisea aurea]|uniref:Uncharacterized protein n=1 Tax=Genlisea aurea TaxID=192259 RepID=S8CAK4_9LAMI|nr:hypothetical protein M569_10846 [Genlisea aurea]